MDVKHLEGVQLFEGLSKQERELVALNADIIDVRAGRELAHEGGIAFEFFVIDSGEAQVRHGQDVVATLGPGDFFGEVGVFAENARRTASVVTTMPTSVILITGPALKVIANHMPGVAERLRAAVAERTQKIT